MTVANNLDRTVTITRPGSVIGQNEFNEDVFGPDVEFTVSASRQDVADGERMAAGSLGGFRMTRFVVRHTQRTAGIVPSDGLRHEGKAYNIIGTKETQDGRRRFIEITASVDTD